MSIHLDGAIKEAYIGRFKLGSIYIGEKELYSGGFKPEPYLPNEYFYFKLDDKSTSAEVGFEELMTGNSTGSATITYDKTKFTNYSTPIFQYSFDKITWNSYTLGTLITLDNIHNKVYFRGNNSSPWFDTYQTTYSETSDSTTYTRYETHWIIVHALIQNAQVRSGGNLLSLRDSNLSNITTIPCDYCFPGLFSGCSNLLTPPILSATTLKPNCYGVLKKVQTSSETPFHQKSYGLFSGCTNLQYAPNLPATTLAEYCYGYMFAGTSFTTPPELSSTTLAPYCYYYMFNNSKITEPPRLPATSLASHCYCGMFSNTIFTNPPQLPATTLADYCYSNMFYNSKITESPVLSATTMIEGCYQAMFKYCTSLIIPPILSSTNLAARCYEDMFAYCSNLTTPPVLPATTLASRCYLGMFYCCTSLTTTPALPATTLAEYCYGAWVDEGMFAGCTSLTRISKLPAATLTTECYYNMYTDWLDNSSSTIKASETQTSICKYAYRIPSTGEGTAASTKSLGAMFRKEDDSGTFSPSINTTFYISVPSF